MTSLETLYNLYLQHPVITTDTRNCPSGSIFFALKGDRFNGNEFAKQALESGSAYAVIDQPEYQTDERFLLVTDVLSTLQLLAAHHRKQLRIPVIGITGTNGKTTTKELTRAVLSTRFNTLATEGNLNNHIGVPLTLLKITPAHEIAIIEMGANHPGEIEMLSNIACPDFGLITNVGKAHLEGFGSFEGVIKTKTELYESLRQSNGKVFLHAENSYLAPYTHNLQTISYGETPGLFVSGKMISCSPLVSFKLSDPQNEIQIDTNLIGSYNLPNLLAAAAIGSYFGITFAEIKSALESYQPANKRSQLVKTARNTLILDAYNANPTSMMAALVNFRDMQVENKTLILGDMRELGNESKKEHERILQFIQETGFDSVFLVGHEFNALPHPFKSFGSAIELKEWFTQHPITNRFILVKGSRGIALETGIESL
ncbi:MAG: UDP-N-acetylmuramoyl-tripeptide--D-alanyl-D-alanine ligase [Bacteroidales bacterium]